MIDISRIWVAEWIACVFFTYLILLVVRRPLPRRNRLRVFAVSIVCIGLSIMLSQLRASPVLQIVRDWIPGIYLMQGYWLCGLFFQRPMTAIEQRLIDIDQVLFKTLKSTEFSTRGPRVILEYFELTYLLAYLFIPASFGVMCWLGDRANADSFWTALLIAGFSTYGLIPWIQTRPPQKFEQVGSSDALDVFFRRLNVTVLNYVSIQVNTFPSGRVAVTFAAALMIFPIDMRLGLIFGILVSSITIATVLGRYQYAVDSIAGVILGVTAWSISSNLV